MSASLAMNVELVRTVTRDGLRLDGALSSGGTASERSASSLPTAAILLHGVAGNFYTSSTFEPLVPKLHELGIAALSVNTRGHDSVFGASLGNVRRRLGAAYEIVDDCRHDLAAWVEFLKCRGCGQIILIGHSLGAIKAVYSQAYEKFVEVAAVVAVSPPRLSYSAFMNAPESSFFGESMHNAEDMVTAGQGDELFTSKFPFPLLITASGYIDKYGPAERYNILEFAAAVPCPALFIYGSKELASGGIPFAGLPEALMSLPNAGGRSTAVIDGADHFYSGLSEALGLKIADWLAKMR
jgi:pimeloyl-ACP methyl ester carboxylesterase